MKARIRTAVVAVSMASAAAATIAAAGGAQASNGVHFELFHAVCSPSYQVLLPGHIEPRHPIVGRTPTWVPDSWRTFPVSRSWQGLSVPLRSGQWVCP
jgi:hypothetical protein